MEDIRHPRGQPGMTINTQRALQPEVPPSPNIASSPTIPSFKVIHDISHLPRKASTRSKETRKLLAHLLRQLASRPLPPTVYETFGAPASSNEGKGFATLVKQAVKVNNKSKPSTYPHGADDDDEGEADGTFSTDVTFELMAQLRDVLMISVLQGWQIFDEGSEETSRSERNNGKSPSPFRRSMNTLHPSGRRSRSPSPSFGGRIQSTELLSQCISVLASVVSEDCRFKITPPRPSRPPNALQALTLKVAQFLLHVHRNNPKVVSQIAYALLPAFFTFPPEMHARLLAFYEESIVRGILESLRDVQGAQDHVTEMVNNANPFEFPEDTEPMVSIRVEGADDDDNSSLHASRPQWAPWVDPLSQQIIHILSTNAPLQGSAVYFLASIVPPLLSAILDNIDLGIESKSGLDVLHRLHRLLDLIFMSKVDAYLDVLEIVAYHTANVRQSAASLLAAFWPKALGHLTVAHALKASAYLANSPATRFIVQDHDHQHQFVPWCFSSTRQTPRHECWSCIKTIDGFGLRCPFCSCQVHFDCYDVPAGCHLAKYSMTTDASVQKVALFRFSDMLGGRRDRGARIVRSKEHAFLPTNLFALCLCSACRQPLWGPYAQGYRCLSCMQFVHASCATGHPISPCRGFEHDSSHIYVDYKTLRDTCVSYFGDIIKFTKEGMRQRTFEEVSSVQTILWIQLRLLTNGVALGCLVITRKGRSALTEDIEPFELHRTLALCEEFLVSGLLPVSEALDEYLQSSRISRTRHIMMFDWANLVYISSTIKSPRVVKTSSSSDLLMVQQPDAMSEPSDTIAHPYELVSFSHLRNMLGYEFNLHMDSAAMLVLGHLQHLGFFDRADGLTSMVDVEAGSGVACIFPFPLGLDFSTDVEALFGAVEACLGHIDLSVNETGFLLLTRKLPPNSMASDYAIKRLVRAIVSWILAEDESLATILRDYIAKQRPLPGVQTSREPTWPKTERLRLLPQNSVNNGGDYVATRRSLLSHYGAPWLYALHNDGPDSYAIMLFDLCLEMSLDMYTTYDVIDPRPRTSLIPGRDEGKHLDKLLRLITRLSQNLVTFVILDDLMNRWLEALAMLPTFIGPIPSLLRLFARDPVDGSYRTSVFDMGQGGAATETANIDPWRRVVTAAMESKDGLLRALHWLYVFVRSGVDVSVQTWIHFSNAMDKFQISVSESLVLVKAILSSMWIKPTARLAIQEIFGALHARHLDEVLEDIKGGVPSPEILLFIRATLGTCLTLYGCDRQKLKTLKMILDEDIEGLPSRRKLNVRSSIVSDPIIIPAALMKVVTAYMEANNEDVSCVVAQFLHMFISESPYLEPYEVDNFILRNGALLSKCAWQLYGIQRDTVSELRASFLLRVIVVDDQPFRLILKDAFRQNGDWQLRLEAVARLFRIILDSPSPHFIVEDRLWRSHVVDVFEYFFTSLWADDREEVRLATETLASTMLSVHFDAISSCWNEVLSKSTVQERTHLVSFLIQLRPHFPHWKVVSWKVIIEALLEDQYDEKEETDGPTSAYLSLYGLSSDDDAAVDRNPLSSESSLLRISLVLLSLNMIAGGIEIEYNDIIRLKEHLARLIGFSKVDFNPSQNGLTFEVTFGEAKEVPVLAQPCIHELTLVLDASYSIDPYPHTGVREDSSTPLLIGGPFVDVALGLFTTLEDFTTLPALSLKSMLEMLAIIIHKQDVERKTHLKHLSSSLRAAVSRALDLLALGINYECRQLALSLVQSFTKTWTGPGLRSFVHLSIEHVAKLVASQSHTSQDSLVAQATTFLESTLVTYSNNGTVAGLFRRPLDREVFLVLKQIIDSNAKTALNPSDTLRERILRDTLPRAVDADQGVFQTVLNNVQTYVEVVCHQGYTADLMVFVGQHLTQLARRSAEFSHQHIKPSPILSIATVLIQYNKALSRDLLTYTDAVLRIILTRLSVETDSLVRLVQVTATLYRRNQPSDSNSNMPPNAVLAVIFELLGDGLRVKARILPSTIKAMIEVLMTTSVAGHSTVAMLCQSEHPALADNGFHFLLNHPWQDVSTDSDFSASLVVANFILQAANHDPSIMSRIGDQTRDRSARHNMLVRAWNILLIAALTDPAESWVNVLYVQLPTFSLAHQGALRGYLQAGSNLPEPSIADINHAYISIKLWLLLAQRRASMEERNSMPAFTVWNELWPPFESLVNKFEGEVQAGLSVTLAILTWTTVADLFIFIRALQSPVAIQSVTHIALLNRLKALGRGEAHVPKLTRALRTLSEPVPEVPFDNLINQTTKDLIAAEKLRVLESRREMGRVMAERRNGRGGG